MAETKTVITLICERAADISSVTSENGSLAETPGVKVIKFPCSGMIQPLMVEAAIKAGADGVIVCGCQIGDCYYREGNKMIKERLLGGRPPGLKKTVDRRRVLALWLARSQKDRFLSETKDFIDYLAQLEPPDKPAANLVAKSAAKPAAKPVAKAAEKPAETSTEKPVEKAAEKSAFEPEDKTEPEKDNKPRAKSESEKDVKKEADKDSGKDDK
ncbi:MAG: hydrogenase iron-sulfur subunit [Candidatus Obscuribacterales bacterium]|nr:hydrogenase iron-sulfur subunit [Candidatus Obscuribacterales bacterium]